MLIGTLVLWVSIPFAAILLLSIFTLLLPYGFLSIKLQAVTSTGIQLGTPGYEIDLLYLACLAALVLGGTGSTFFQSGSDQRGLGRKNSGKFLESAS
ncbi:MAG: hypothetical protein ACJ71Q_16505 [Terriglobales bacterium]